MTARAPVHPGELLLSLGLVALGVYVVNGTGGIARPRAMRRSGRGFFPT